MALEDTSPQVVKDQLIDTKYAHSTLNSTPTTAGGFASPGFDMGSINVGIYFGSGAPTITAPQGSIYLRTDGSSTSTRLYVNTNGATTWTNFTSAA